MRAESDYLNLDAANAHIMRILELDFGAELEQETLAKIASEIASKAEEVSHDIGMNLTTAGEEVLIGGKVVTTMHAPCLIGESPLQLLGHGSSPVGRSGGVGAGGVAANLHRSTTDADESDRAHFATDARATADVRTISVCASYAVPSHAMVEKNFVRGLFRRIADLSFAADGLLEMLWSSLRHKAHPPGTFIPPPGQVQMSMCLLARGPPPCLRAESGATVLE
ncbi:hypothetical protein T492DRAFT_854133, partial [Pavlovales sp. CCMP2436]